MNLVALIPVCLMLTLCVYSLYGLCMANYYLKQDAEVLLQVPGALKKLRKVRRGATFAIVLSLVGAALSFAVAQEASSLNMLYVAIAVFASYVPFVIVAVYLWHVNWRPLRKPLSNCMKLSVGLHPYGVPSSLERRSVLSE